MGLLLGGAKGQPPGQAGNWGHCSSALQPQHQAALFSPITLAFGRQPVDPEGVYNKALKRVVRVCTVTYSSTGCLREGLFYWLVLQQSRLKSFLSEQK